MSLLSRGEHVSITICAATAFLETGKAEQVAQMNGLSQTDCGQA